MLAHLSVFTRIPLPGQEGSRINFELILPMLDKLLNRKQRDLIETERLNTSDPREFWKHIQKLGPSSKRGIPWEVYEGNIITDKELILKHCKSEYNKNVGHSSIIIAHDSFQNLMVPEEAYIAMMVNRS